VGGTSLCYARAVGRAVTHCCIEEGGGGWTHCLQMSRGRGWTHRLQMRWGRGGAAAYCYIGEGGGAVVRYFIRDRVAAMDSGRVASASTFFHGVGQSRSSLKSISPSLSHEQSSTESWPVVQLSFDNAAKEISVANKSSAVFHW
jgi:hypothetical protein